MKRTSFIHKIDAAFAVHPITAILGPRQCGKTTLANMYSQSRAAAHFDLEDSRDLAMLDNPLLALEELTGLIIIDEIQRRPELFPTLRVLVDKKGRQQKYLILGSASRDLIKQSSETLTGRIEYIELTPFSYTEVGDIRKLWLRGGFPRSYLANNDIESMQWRKAYISTFLERDIPNLGFNIPPQTLRRFWMMLVHYHGNIFNASEIGRSLGIANTSIRNYLDILSGTFMMRELHPWIINIKKRQVKSPKIYFRDTGILNALLGIENFEDLRIHPKLGSLWEGLALEEIIRFHGASENDCYFWATHSGAELDLLIVQGSKKLGFEFKYTDNPKLTKSMQIAMRDLDLTSLTVIFPNKTNFPLTEKIRAIGLEEYLKQSD